MTSARRALRPIEEHFTLGLPVLFSELLVFKWTPTDGFPPVSEEFRQSFERMQEIENLENELLVFFSSFPNGRVSMEDFETRRNTFKFLDQYGCIEDVLGNDSLRVPVTIGKSLVPDYLEERIRNQEKWFRGDDEFSMMFAKEFLRRKFCSLRISQRPQQVVDTPPKPPPRRHRSNGANQQPSTSQGFFGFTASGKPRRNSAPTPPSLSSLSPAKPRRMTAEELPSPPPTPPALRTTSRSSSSDDHIVPNTIEDLIEQIAHDEELSGTVLNDGNNNEDNVKTGESKQEFADKANHRNSQVESLQETAM